MLKCPGGGEPLVKLWCHNRVDKVHRPIARIHLGQDLDSELGVAKVILLKAKSIGKCRLVREYAKDCFAETPHISKQ
jgi:hypothetical protein